MDWRMQPVAERVPLEQVASWWLDCGNAAQWGRYFGGAIVGSDGRGQEGLAAKAR
jgi:hypothetical protein